MALEMFIDLARWRIGRRLGRPRCDADAALVARVQLPSDARPGVVGQDAGVVPRPGAGLGDADDRGAGPTARFDQVRIGCRGKKKKKGWQSSSLCIWKTIVVGIGTLDYCN